LWIPSEAPELVSRHARGDLAVHRRHAVVSIIGLLAGNALLEAVEPWLSHDAAPEALRRPPGIGYQELSQIEYVARSFREWDQKFGGGLKRMAVVGQLAEVADELNDHSHSQSIRTRLFAVLAQLAETAAIMSWDSGQGQLAQHYYVLALRSAKEASDRDFGANVLAGMARQLLYLDRPEDALELVRLAIDGIAPSSSHALRAMLYTREAWAYAHQGRHRAFWRAVGRARESLDQAIPDTEPHWIRYFDDAELSGVIGGRLLELAHLGQPTAGHAAEQIERAIVLRGPDNLRSSALDRIGLADARLLSGEIEEAVRLGRLALAAAEMTRSDRVRHLLLEFSTHAAKHPDVLPLRQLTADVAYSLNARGLQSNGTGA
jgi:hypothetical protein